MMTPSLLPSFLVAGFECSTPINRDGVRIDEVSMTQHDSLVHQDYCEMRRAGILAARDGVRWNLVDQAGRLDFSTVLPFLAAADDHNIRVVWDLFHYGYPADLDPFDDDFVHRFADYCYAFARLVTRRFGPGNYYTPVNEISYFAWAGGDNGIFAPHCVGRGPELKRQLARTSICGMDAILARDPAARFVHCEPLVHVVAPADAPELAGEAEYFNRHFVHEAWDLIGGCKEPELGGSARHLDIIGVNYYGYNQWEHTRPHNVLAPCDPRRVPFSELLQRLQRRYARPVIVTETSSHGDLRPSWMRHIGDECLAAIRAGVDLHGLCIYPVIDMFDWHSRFDGMPLGMGLWELRAADAVGGSLARVPHAATFRELRRLERRLCMLPTYRPMRARSAASGRSG